MPNPLSYIGHPRRSILALVPSYTIRSRPESRYISAPGPSYCPP
ncbi:hypothetical protein FOXYSP1_21125 [Fusarium oxysporum f. sp. phaseoli]